MKSTQNPSSHQPFLYILCAFLLHFHTQYPLQYFTLTGYCKRFINLLFKNQNALFFFFFRMYSYVFTTLHGSSKVPIIYSTGGQTLILVRSCCFKLSHVSFAKNLYFKCLFKCFRVSSLFCVITSISICNSYKCIMQKGLLSLNI